MEKEQVFPFSVASVIEDVLQQYGTRLKNVEPASRKTEEPALRRYEAAGWLRKMIGAGGGKDFPAEPSEEEFRLGLRSGIILCNVLNKVQPGAVSKVVEGPCDSVTTPDGAALSAFQYFENVRNFHVAAEEIGLPTFQASDLGQEGKSARIVNCVLALKSYSDWKAGGGNGSWKFGGNVKPPTSWRPFMRKNSESFTNSFTRTSSSYEKSLDGLSDEQSLHGDFGHDLSDASSSRSWNMLVRELFFDKKQEEIPIFVESMLCKITEEIERRLATHTDLMKATSESMSMGGADKTHAVASSDDMKMEGESASETEVASEAEVASEEKVDDYDHKNSYSEGPNCQLLRKQMLFEEQQRHIEEFKHTLHVTKAGIQFLQMKHQEEFNNLGKHLYGLAHAASEYQRVLDENRKLYNQVQDLKGNIRVYCRVRPFLRGHSNCLSTIDHIEEGDITIITPSKYGKEGKKLFSFNKLFGPSATQEEVFSDTQPLIRSVLDGYNVCIFAYGQTGSGKTFTMSGPTELTEETLGVNYRALSDLFLLSAQRRDSISYEIFVQMLEIYNEQLRDLLVMDGSNKRLEVRNSSQNGINVPDACLVPVSSTSDVINLMNIGQKNRAVSATAMNDRSSRSHSCLTVHVQGRNLTSGATLRGCMHLVDLAGSERIDKSEVTGDRLKEAQHINKSLSALGDVISSLAQKNSHVPYRNSKLTQLLQDSLGGQAKTLMFVHISPEAEALGETISTLKFAERVSTIELGAARVNKDSADVRELKEQIASLKAALARKEGETEHRQHSRPSTPERYGAKSGGSSPSSRGWKSIGDMSSSKRQSLEGVCNIELVRNPTELNPKRKSLDPQELMRTSIPWPSVSKTTINGKEDDRESVSSDCADKVMRNKHDIFSRDDDLLELWDVENKESPEILSQSYPSNPSKMFSENQFSKSTGYKKDSKDCDVRKSQYEVASTDDELEAATSESSEPDMLWQLNLPRVTSIPNNLGSKTKKINLRHGRSMETRSMIPSLIPQPSRKGQNNVVAQPTRTGRRPVSAEGKRGTGKAK